MEEVVQLTEADIPRAQTAGEIPVIEKVEWLVMRGEFWVVGAQAGAGKTDLLCTAAGLLRPVKGSQRLFGRDLDTMTEEELVQTRLRIAMVFESGRLFKGLTVAQNIALPLSYHHELPPQELARRVTNALERTGLVPWQNKRPDQITRNLHQRVGLARALALNPEVLVIDNPLATIDPRQARWWVDFLCESQKNMTIIVAVADFRPWLDVGREFALIKERHMEVIGDREAIRESKDELVRELLSPAFGGG
jgi:ABC-type transporter Mla maintaining outer membrane lipid asymmetry ATPase subunit MlaF